MDERVGPGNYVCSSWELNFLNAFFKIRCSWLVAKGASPRSCIAQSNESKQTRSTIEFIPQRKVSHSGKFETDCNHYMYYAQSLTCIFIIRQIEMIVGH